MSTEHVIHSISRLVEVLADKSSIDGMADSVFPMNSAAFGERERMKNERFNNINPKSEIEKFPYVGVLKMNCEWYSLLEALSEARCENWKIYYGNSHTSILVDESESIKFSCFDHRTSADEFFYYGDEIEVTSINLLPNCFRINAKAQVHPTAEEPVYLIPIAIHFRYRARDL